MSMPKIFAVVPLADLLPLFMPKVSKLWKHGSEQVPVEGFRTQQAVKDEGFLETFRMGGVGVVGHVFLCTGQDWGALMVVTEQSMGNRDTMFGNEFLDSSKGLRSEK